MTSLNELADRLSRIADFNLDSRGNAHRMQREAITELRAHADRERELVEALRVLRGAVDGLFVTCSMADTPAPDVKEADRGN